MNSIFLPIIGMGVVVLGLFFFVVLGVAFWTGFNLGRRRGARLEETEKESTATSTLTASMLGLMAFVLGLTINVAQSRFEARREMVTTEANTIGTAWLRARLVGGPEGEAMAGLIHDYARTRLAFTAADHDAPIPGLIARTGEQQGQIWALATSVAQKAPTPITASLIGALNQMFDSSLSQRFAFEGVVPGDMVNLLFFGSMLAVGAMGYLIGLSGVSQPVLTSLLLIMWSGGLAMTVDLERPRLGDIRVETTPLEWTIQGMESGPARPSSTTSPGSNRLSP